MSEAGSTNVYAAYQYARLHYYLDPSLGHGEEQLDYFDLTLQTPAVPALPPPENGPTPAA